MDKKCLQHCGGSFDFGEEHLNVGGCSFVILPQIVQIRDRILVNVQPAHAIPYTIYDRMIGTVNRIFRCHIEHVRTGGRQGAGAGSKYR